MRASRDPPIARPLVRLLPAIMAAAALVPAVIAVSRTTAQGTPALPDLDQEAPSRLVVTHAGKRARATWRLGFRSAVRNVGDGPLIIDGRRPDPGQRTMSAEQAIVRDGAPTEVVPDVGRLRYVRSPDHEHWHLLGFDRYELRRPGAAGPVVEDRKSGFCLGDRYPIATREFPRRAPAPVYTSRCGLERPGLLGIREGISVGYGDDYAANLEGQWLPLDGLRAGRYELVHRVNGERRLRESSYANNAASMLLRLRWRRGEPLIDVLAICPERERCRRGPSG